MTKDGLSVNECEHVPLKFKFSTCNALPPTFWISFEQNTCAILPKCCLILLIKSACMILRYWNMERLFQCQTNQVVFTN